MPANCTENATCLRCPSRPGTFKGSSLSSFPVSKGSLPVPSLPTATGDISSVSQRPKPPWLSQGGPWVSRTRTPALHPGTGPVQAAPEQSDPSGLTTSSLPGSLAAASSDPLSLPLLRLATGSAGKSGWTHRARGRGTVATAGLRYKKPSPRGAAPGSTCTATSRLHPELTRGDPAWDSGNCGGPKFTSSHPRGHRGGSTLTSRSDFPSSFQRNSTQLQGFSVEMFIVAFYSKGAMF